MSDNTLTFPHNTENPTEPTEEPTHTLECTSEPVGVRRGDSCCGQDPVSSKVLLRLVCVCACVYLHTHNLKQEVQKQRFLQIRESNPAKSKLISIYTSVATCLSVSHSIFLSTCLSLSQPVCLPTCLSLSPSSFLPVSLSLSPCKPVCLSNSQSTCMSVCLSLFFPICLHL